MSKKNLTIIIATLAIIFIVLVLTLILNKPKPVTTGINILVVPSDSEIFIDSKKASTGINAATPGKHSVEARHTNFYTQQTFVTVSDGQISFLPIELPPSNGAGQEWVQANSKAFLDLEGLGSKASEKQGEALSKTYPIITNLPIDSTPDYRIDYGVSEKYPNDAKKIAIYISFNTPSDKISALQNIYNLGFDPSDYEIIFEGL